MPDQPTALPLAGIRVVELGHSVAAPYAASVLAELGAEVVKIEKPGKGDDARNWGPPFHEGVSTLFQALNRNKASVVVDLGDEPARSRLRRLIVAETDILIQNLRPGHAESLGLGPEALLAENPRLICAAIGAFGATGPLADRPGYDPLMQAFGGIMSVTGEAGRPPVRVGTSLVDMGAGMWIVIGVMAALLRRQQTGKGGMVGTSLFETALGWMTYHITGYSVSGEQPLKQGAGSPFLSPYGAYAAADGDILLTAGNDSLFRRLVGAIGRQDMADDPRFVANPDRVRNRAALDAMINQALSAGSIAVWTERFEAVGVPCAPIQTIAEVVAHPQTSALGMLRSDGEGGPLFVGLPLTLDGVRPARGKPAPALGADASMLFADQPLSRSSRRPTPP